MRSYVMVGTNDRKSDIGFYNTAFAPLGLVRFENEDGCVG